MRHAKIAACAIFMQFLIGANSVAFCEEVRQTSVAVHFDPTEGFIRLTSTRNSFEFDFFTPDKSPLVFSVKGAAPQDIQIVLTAEWREERLIMPLDIRPINFGRSIPVFFKLIDKNIDLEDFDKVVLDKESNKNCYRDWTGIENIQEKFFLCQQLFRAYLRHGQEHSTAALKAFKGWFDLYYKLNIIKDSPYGRSSEIENYALEIENMIVTDKYIRNKLKSLGVGRSYYSFRIGELEKASLKVANEVGALIKDGDIKGAAWTNEILKNRYDNISKISGRYEINGITEKLIENNDQFIKSINELF